MFYSKMTEKEKRLYDRIVETIENMDDSEQVALWWEYCEKCNLYDDYIYSMDEIDEILGEQKPSELLSNVSSNFNYSDDWFYFNGYGHICSCWCPNTQDSPFSVHDLASEICDNNDSFHNDTIDEILEEYYYSEDEEDENEEVDENEND